MRQDSIFASSPHVLQTTGLGSSASSHSSAVTEDLRTLVFNQIHCLLWPVWSTHHSAVLVMFKRHCFAVDLSKFFLNLGSS